MGRSKTIERIKDWGKILIEIKDLRKFILSDNTISLYDAGSLTVEYVFNSFNTARTYYHKIGTAMEYGAKSVVIEWVPDLPEELEKEMGI